MYGLPERDIKMILEAVQKYEEIQKVLIFGSRAMGNYKKASDIDLALLGENISRKTILRLNDELNEEYPIPYFFDILNYNEISNQELKNHIDTEGKLLYTRT